MKIKLAIGFVLLCLCPLAYSQSATPDKLLSVEVFEGDYATVNSFIFSNGKELLVMDVQRKPAEAARLIERVLEIGLPLSYILITHGHTDHFTGMGLFRAAFPDTPIVVANRDIRDDIEAYARYMDSGGATEGEPALDPSIKPRSPDYPEGFDYENWIEILECNHIELPSGGRLELQTEYLPTEAEHMTTVYSKDLNALFLSDLGYHRVHHWQGDDISWQDIANWRTELSRLKEIYAARNPVIYPGHGKVTDTSIFDNMVAYIDDYTRIVQGAASFEVAYSSMVELYPDFKEADFFLYFSLLNHMRDVPQ